jgi:hypothetical protein
MALSTGNPKVYYTSENRNPAFYADTSKLLLGREIMLKFIKKWYQGEEYNVSTPDFPIFPGIRYRRNWSSLLVHNVIEFYLKEWKWLWGILISIAGLAIAIGKLK